MFWLGLILGLLLAAVTGASCVAYFRRALRHAETRAREQERQLRESARLAELGTLTGGLAHEIKNPLSTVQLNLQLLSEDLPRDLPGYPRVAARLQTVTRETLRLREILDDFLRYAGKIELDRKPVDLRRVVEELTDFYLPQAQMQRVNLRVSLADGPVVAMIDERLVKQAVLNLMINALQAIGDGGGDLILAVRLDAASAVVTVTDTGTGIPPDAVARIFQAYYSTKKGGTGLGLAMALRIAREHGGELSVRSEPGKGSEFTFALPVAAPTPAA